MDGSAEGSREGAAIVLTKRSALGLLVLILLAGMLVGRSLATDGAADAAARQDEATPASETGTVESETDELNRLQRRSRKYPTAPCPP